MLSINKGAVETKKGGMELRKRKQTRLFSIAASVLMVFSLTTPAMAASTEMNNNKLHHSLRDSNVISQKKVSNRLLDSFKDENMVTFLVKFKEQADSEQVAAAAKQQASRSESFRKAIGHDGKICCRLGTQNDIP